MTEEGFAKATQSYDALSENAKRRATKIARTVYERSKADHVSLRFCDPYPMLMPLCRFGYGAEKVASRFCVGEGVIGWAAQTGKTICVGNVKEDRRFVQKLSKGYAIRSVLCAPIKTAQATLGVLSLSSRQTNAFSPEDEEFVDLMAGCIAEALENSVLERESLLDTLTGAYNRRYLERCLAHSPPSAGQTGTSLLAIDLDHFKSVNDRYGHQAGDEVLKEFVERCQSAVRSKDVVVREGGEEFVLVMPETELAEAAAAAVRIGEATRMRPFVYGIEQTASIGVAHWEIGESSKSLRKRADLAMYKAKHNGRDRVIVSDSHGETQWASASQRKEEGAHGLTTSPQRIVTSPTSTPPKHSSIFPPFSDSE